jgi:hypothetical protein
MNHTISLSKVKLCLAYHAAWHRLRKCSDDAIAIDFGRKCGRTATGLLWDAVSSAQSAMSVAEYNKVFFK